MEFLKILLASALSYAAIFLSSGKLTILPAASSPPVTPHDSKYNCTPAGCSRQRKSFSRSATTSSSLRSTSCPHKTSAVPVFPYGYCASSHLHASQRCKKRSKNLCSAALSSRKACSGCHCTPNTFFSFHSMASMTPSCAQATALRSGATLSTHQPW